MKVQEIEVKNLLPYAFNNRIHSEQQVDRIAHSIKEFGFNQPIVVDQDLTVIVGHGRLEAAKKLGLKKVPCVQLSDLTETQKKAYRILDNKLQNDSEWNFQSLELELASLEEAGFDLPAWGLEDLKDLIPEPPTEVTEDEIPDVKDSTVIKLGDLIELGEHRLLCGDSTEPTEVKLLMNGEKAALCQTDPPYGIAYVSNAKSKGQALSHCEIENDELDGEKLQSFLEATIRSALPWLVDNCAFYLWHPMLTQGTFFAAAAAAAADIIIHRQIIWCKPSLVFGRGDYHWQHELCFYGWRKGHRPSFFGERNQTTLWHVGRETSKAHPTAKPVGIWEAPLKNHTKKRDIIYEPFMGSGSQLIAADQLSRRCYGIEISPKYCQVIVDRYRAYCEKAGKPFVCKLNGEDVSEWICKGDGDEKEG